MCYNPRKVKNPDGSYSYYACGHCLQCLKQYQDQWTARLSEELKSWRPVPQDSKMIKPVIFFTLKYAAERINCSYLVLTRNGWYVSDSRPDCEVLRFWTDNSESHEDWLCRRKSMLERYARVYSTLASARSLCLPDSELCPMPDFHCDYEHASWSMDDFLRRHALDSRREIEFRVFGESVTPHPVYKEHLPQLFSEFELFPPVLAVEFHTVRKEDVQGWMKRGRRRLDYHGVDVRDRFISTWKDIDGVEHSLPDSAVPGSASGVKYFITSEYGPQTHRPHMHGVIFGLTYEEFYEYFAKDWMSNFGVPGAFERGDKVAWRSIDFSVYNPSRGGMTYLSKYCSKGGYEHPYCCKDFFYPSGGEYHSKSFEQSVADFDVDASLVKPTFHLISKGIGTSYAFGAEVQKYFGVSLAAMRTQSGKLRYTCTDDLSSIHSALTPSVDLSELLFLDEVGNPCAKSVELEFRGNDLVVRKYHLQDGEPKYLIGESVIGADSIVNQAIEELMCNQKYSRTYVVSSQKESSKPCVSCWHKIGVSRLINPQAKTTRITLPRFYRQWLVSPLSSALRTSAARRLHPDEDETISRILLSNRPINQKMAAIESVRSASALVKAYSYESLRRSADRMFYSHSGINEID